MLTLVRFRLQAAQLKALAESRGPESARTLADRLDAVVVDYYSGEALARCVESLHRSGCAGVVVVVTTPSRRAG